MNYKKANLTYLFMILSSLGLSFLMVIWFLVGGGEISILVNNVASESMILIPAIAMVLYCGEKLSSLIPFHKIKISSAILIVIYVILLFPLVTFVNAVSMLFVENVVTSITDDILKLPVWMMILSIGIFGPFVEEVAFRGVLLQSYQRTGKILASIILSSILFGMMHMNFNQFAYATVMGIMLALLVEATGSVLSSFLAHALFNSVEVLMMYAQKDAIGEAAEVLNKLDTDTLGAPYFAGLFVAALLFTTIAICVLYKIAKIEHREAFLSSIPRCEKKGYQLISVSLVLAVTVALGFMILTLFI